LNCIGFMQGSDNIVRDRNDEFWMWMLEELMEYKEKHGDCLVSWIYDGIRRRTDSDKNT